MSGPNKTFARDQEISWRVIEDEAVLVDRDEGEMLRLNPIATEIWQAIDGKRNLTEIADYICKRFDVKPRKAQKDVRRFVQQLLRREMVKEIAEEGTEAS